MRTRWQCGSSLREKRVIKPGDLRRKQGAFSFFERYPKEENVPVLAVFPPT
jgi:hypothetical protein